MRKISLSLLLIFLFFELSSQTYLEVLWKQSETYSKELKINLLDYENTLLEYNSRYSLFYPSFYISTNYDYIRLETPKDLNKYPLKYYTSFGFDWDSMGGTSLQTSISYEMNRYILDSLEELSVDNSGYNQNPVLSLSINQSLLPYYLQGKAKNPFLLSYDNQFKSAQNSILTVMAGIKTNITDYFIQLRKLLRNQIILTNQIEMQTILCDAAFIKLEQGSITQLDYWNYESSLNEYQNNLCEVTLQIDNIKRELELLCGNINYAEINNELPASSIRLLEKDYTLETFEIQKDELDNNLIISRQNNAPSLSITGSYSYDLDAVKLEKTKEAWSSSGEKKWTVSVGFSISPKNVNQINKEKAAYRNNIQSLEEQKTIYLENKTEEISTYKKLITYYTDVQSQKKKNVEKQNAYYEAMQDKYNRGLCSELDLLQAKLIYDNSKFDLENINDSLWYYNFLLYQLEVEK
jgi:outer membrane protein TolC